MAVGVSNTNPPPLHQVRRLTTVDARGRRVGKATRCTVSVLGAIVALAGVEHGIGETLQGNIAPTGPAIESWPTADAFRVLSGEPAMTVVPNLLATGVLAIVASLLFLVWATAFVDRRHSGAVLTFLAVVMLLVGAGFGPPLIGVMLGLVATGIFARRTRTAPRFSGAVGRLLTACWPWSLVADAVAWLAIVPGVVAVGSVFGAHVVPPTLVYALMAAAFGFLPLAIASALAYDARAQLVTARLAPSRR